MDYPAVVIVGSIGSGKTTLLNKICKSQEKTKSGGKSLTRNVFLKGSAYGNGFYIMDTPGFGSDTDELAHISAVYTALIEKPLSKILLVVEFDRLPKMRIELFDILLMLDRYREYIVLVITHWDKSTDPVNDEIEIQHDVVQKVGLKDYILSGLNTTGENICKQIDNLLLTSKQVELEIDQTEFFSLFNLKNSELLDINLKKQVLKLQKEFQLKCDIFEDFINKMDGKDTETPEILHALTLAIKNIGTIEIEKFEQDNAKVFDDILKKINKLELAYILPMLLKKEILDSINKIIQLSANKMKEYPHHIYNFIKQCPNCKLIWIKVEGCNGPTTCGNFPEKDLPEFQPTRANYEIQLIDNQIRLIKKQEQKIMEKKVQYSIQEKDKQKIMETANGIVIKIVEERMKMMTEKEKKNIITKYQPKSAMLNNLTDKELKQIIYEEEMKKIVANKESLGCGQTLTWSQLPPLPAKIIFELEQAGFLDFFQQTKKEQEKFKQTQMRIAVINSIQQQQQQISVDLNNLNERNKP